MKTIITTEQFIDWFRGLRDRTIRTRIQARIDRAALGNFGDCAPVGQGVSEMRLHFGAGYRVYFIEQGLEIIILLVGGDKSTQSNDIDTAITLANDIRSTS